MSKKLLKLFKKRNIKLKPIQLEWVLSLPFSKRVAFYVATQAAKNNYKVSNDDMVLLEDYLNTDSKIKATGDHSSNMIQVQAWKEKQLEKIQIKIEDDSTRIIDMGNGWSWVDLRTEPQIQREGKIMSHCVHGSHYVEGVMEGRMKLYSLRDKDNKPQLTVQYMVNDKHLRQYRGFANANANIQQRFKMLPLVAMIDVKMDSGFFNDFDDTLISKYRVEQPKLFCIQKHGDLMKCGYKGEYWLVSPDNTSMVFQAIGDISKPIITFKDEKGFGFLETDENFTMISEGWDKANDYMRNGAYVEKGELAYMHDIHGGLTEVQKGASMVYEADGIITMLDKEHKEYELAKSFETEDFFDEAKAFFNRKNGSDETD